MRPPPPVAEPDELVAVDRLALADDGPEDGVQARAVPAPGEHRRHASAADPTRARSIGTLADGLRFSAHVARPRHRRRHHRRARLRARRRRHARSATPTASSRSTSRGRAGSSTTPRRSGRPPRRCAPSSPTGSGAAAVHRHHQPARDGRGVEPVDGPAARTAPSCGRTGAPPTAATRSPAAGHLDLVRRRTGLVLDPYFSGTKIAWLLERGRRRRRTRPRRRHRRLVARVEAHRRRGARHRAVERQPHDALRHRRAAMVRRSCATSSACPRRRCPRCARRSVRFGDDPCRRHPHHRDPRRPAGGPVRPGLPRAGHGQEHLRHRLLRARQRRRHLPRAGRGAAHHRGLGPRRRAAASPTPSRAPSSSPAPRCSGSATGSA